MKDDKETSPPATAEAFKPEAKDRGPIEEAGRWAPLNPEALRQPVEAADLVNATLEMVEHRARRRIETTGVPTGFSRLDYVSTGLQPESMVLLAGAPSSGKSTLALNIVVNAGVDMGIPTLVFSPDSSRYALNEGVLAMKSGIPRARLQRGLIEYSHWKNEIYPNAKTLASAPVAVIDDPDPTLGSIREAITRLMTSEPGMEVRRRVGMKALVVVDGLHMIVPPFRGDTQEREIAEVARGLKSIARGLRVPILATSSLNRRMTLREDKRPLLSDLRGSGVLEDTADLILFLHRPELVEGLAVDPRMAAERGTTELIVAKNRNGPVGSLLLRLTEERGFTDPPDEA